MKKDTKINISSAFIVRFKNAQKVIAQIKNGKWKPRWDSIRKAHLTANRGELELWLGNGSFFCEIIDKNRQPYFGLIWRHYVWWAAGRNLKLLADKKAKQVFDVPRL